MAAKSLLKKSKDGRWGCLTQSLKHVLPLFLAAVLAGASSTQVSADEAGHHTVGAEDHMKIWEISNGGILYDDWAAALMIALPDMTHPAYPSAGKQKGGTTWRCKECHGWDYKGKDGAYGKGSHFTGIKGINGMAGVSVDKIKTAIRDKTHGYSEAMLPEKALGNLALFVSQGQIEMAKHVDANTNKARGDAQRGARFFQTVCAICHGYDGKKINFEHDELAAPEYIGTVAGENPWEALHKIRSGQPGMPMVSLIVLDIQDQVDVLTYTQTLPTK